MIIQSISDNGQFINWPVTLNVTIVNNYETQWYELPIDKFCIFTRLHNAHNKTEYYQIHRITDIENILIDSAKELQDMKE